MRYSKRNIILFSLAVLSVGIVLFLYLSKRQTESKTPETRTYVFQKPPEFQESDKSKLNVMVATAQNWIKSHFGTNVFSGGYLISWKGHSILEGYQGFAGYSEKKKISENTPIHIASISKTFTAMAVLKLASEHKIEIDSALSFYFPNFNYSGITVKMLLNHRSGLPKYEYFLEKLKWPQNVFATNADILKQLIDRKAEIDDIQRPDTHFKYCNTNFVLLALIIEKVTGKSYPEYMQTEIFAPLGMKNSFVYSDKDSSKITPSFERNGAQFAFNHLDKIYGDKNIFSTPRDLLIWDEGLKRSNFLNSDMLEMAYTPYSNEKAGSRNYGLGWRMMLQSDGRKLIYHNGWWHGNNTVFLRLLDQDATVIVLGNQYNKGVYKAKEMLSIFDPRFISEKTEE
jgi:CubicO group peptidase (beta-lactamase class C family)